MDRSRSKSWPVVINIDDRDHDRPIGQRSDFSSKIDKRIPAIGRDPASDIDKTERPPWLRKKGTFETVSKEPRYVLEAKPGRERGE